MNLKILMFETPREEEAEELLDKTAKHIVKMKMESPAILFLDMVKPLGDLSGQFGQIFIVPFLPFNEEEISRIIDVLGNTNNIEKLIRKIEKLIMENKEKEERDRKNLFDKIKERIQSII